MRIVTIGTVLFSKTMLDSLIEERAEIVGHVSMASPRNSDHYDFKEYCQLEGINHHRTDDINSPESIKWIKSYAPDVIFCVGWSQIIKDQLLYLSPHGVIGYHPSELPKNRGRHPIIWAIALGLARTASTFFIMDKNADSGDILSQEDIVINYEDTAASLYKKLELCASKQIKELYNALLNGTVHAIKQDHSKANYWRKRTNLDGKLDFRMGSRTIYNLIRALTRPYPGAFLIYKSREIKIWASFEKECLDHNIEPGKILAVENGQISVKTADGAIVLTEHEFLNLPKAGEYL